MTADSAAATPSPRRGMSTRLVRWADVALLAGILLAIAANFFLAARQTLNWDEFNFLSQVHAYLRGELADRLQTFHVHLFTWLPGISPNEADQIVAVRTVMAVVAAANALLIYFVARRFVDRHAALFGLCAYLGMSFVIDNGTSFRTDPMATFLALLACVAILRWPGGATGAAIAGAIMALGMMVTIKSIFYVGAFGLVFLAMGETWREKFRLGIMFGATAAPVLALLYWLHAGTLAASPDVVPLAGLGGTGSKMFLTDGLFPTWQFWVSGVLANPIFAMAVVVGASMTTGTLRRSADRRDRREAWLLLAVAVPILTPLIYRNAFDYYYVFILPPAAWLACIAYRRLRARALATNAGFPARLLVTIVVLQLLFLGAYIARDWPDRIEPQRLTIAGVHQVFPDPVVYIDGFGVVSSFPRVGFFMSSWGIDSYRNAGRPVMEALVAEHRPPMLLADAMPLHDALLPGLKVPEKLRLLPEDAAFLTDHYLQYWGMLFVAGKQLAVPGDGPLEFTVAVAGDYRLEGAVPVRIDGKLLPPDGVVMLNEGRHRVETDTGAGAAIRLVWAAAHPVPSQAPVSIETFFGVAPFDPAVESKP